MKHLSAKHTVWIGFGLSLLGPGLIWAGDGGESHFRQGIVVSGLILTLSGLGLLRYRLFAIKKSSNGP